MSDGLRYRQARWCEPIVTTLGRPGERGYLVPPADPGIVERVGPGDALVPPAATRREPPALPELAQPDVLRHFLRLSQETLGAAVGNDVGQGTATVKFSPPSHERAARSPRLTELHPQQPDETVQGLLELLHRFERILCELSGLDRFSFQPGGGTHGIYANALIIRAFHAANGEAATRDEIVTTAFSHPADAAAPATAGFRVVTLQPGPRGYPELDALKAAVSERTAGLMIANPEDTGIFNPEIDRFVEVVHQAGGLCAYDQANANGILGITRAGDAGFDLCQFNLHKTFSSPHASGGLACGAIGVTERLARFLPAPVLEPAGDGAWRLDWERPDSIGSVRAFHGVVGAVVRAYAWVRALGPDGIRRAAETAVLNNNYLAARLTAIPGIEVSYAAANPLPRLEQVRYSLAQVAEQTGVDTQAISRRVSDHGVAGYFPAHHPWLVPEPGTFEPTESTSKAELDRFVEAVRATVEEARTDPDHVHAAPHASAIHRVDEGALDDPDRWALTWRAHERKRAGRG